MGPARHLLEQDLPLVVTGLAAGVTVGLLRRPGGRRWGAGPVIVALVVALLVSGRSDLPVPRSLAAVIGAAITVAAVVGTSRVLAPPARWEPVAAGALLSVVAVWVGVPETGPVAVTAGVVAGLAGATRLTGARWAPSAGGAVAAAIGWAAASGAAGRPWAALGGALCAGVAPWLSLPLLRPARPPAAPADPSTDRRDRPGPAGGAPWLLVAHGAVALVAARWVAAGAGASWSRAAAVALAGAVASAIAVAVGRGRG
jgi:hypothetical protein